MQCKCVRFSRCGLLITCLFYFVILLLGGRTVNRIRVVDSSGVLSDYVGGVSQSCECQQGDECQCQPQTLGDPVGGVNEPRLGAPTAVTVTPDGIVHVADMGSLRVHSITVTLPTSTNGFYDVIDDTAQELYSFNRSELLVVFIIIM